MIALFILDLFLCSLLSFLTLVLLCELFFFVARIRHPRVRATLRLIPLFKLPLNLLFCSFSGWALRQGINPAECVGARYISLELGSGRFHLFNGAKLWTADGRLFTPLDCLVDGDSRYLWLVVAALGTLTCLSLARWCMGFWKGRGELRNVPHVRGFWRPQIYMPSAFANTLTPEELKAVMAHERAHIRWLDAPLSLLFSLMNALFWWVPTGFWIRKLEAEQEEGCDRAASKRCGALPLASAIHKGLRMDRLPVGAVGFLSKRRVAQILRPQRRERISLTLTKSVLALAIGEVLLFGSYWML